MNKPDTPREVVNSAQMMAASEIEKKQVPEEILNQFKAGTFVDADKIPLSPEGDVSLAIGAAIETPSLVPLRPNDP